MTDLSRRAFVTAISTLGVAGCVSQQQAPAIIVEAPHEPVTGGPASGVDPVDAEVYGPIAGERFPIAAVNIGEINRAFLRRTVDYPSRQPPGTIVVDPARRYLYSVQEAGRAIRYGVGVGREGFAWSGDATVNSKQEWPDWYPPKEMIERQPELKKQVRPLQSGLGIEGGPRNPLGARALYLWQGNRDTLFRIHGTTEPWTIGRNVSSGCIRLINQDAIDLYNRTPVGTKVVVLGAERTA